MSLRCKTDCYTCTCTCNWQLKASNKQKLQSWRCLRVWALSRHTLLVGFHLIGQSARFLSLARKRGNFIGSIRHQAAMTPLTGPTHPTSALNRQRACPSIHSQLLSPHPAQQFDSLDPRRSGVSRGSLPGFHLFTPLVSGEALPSIRSGFSLRERDGHPTAS